MVSKALLIELVTVFGTGAWAFLDTGWDSVISFITAGVILLLHLILGKRAISLGSGHKGADKAFLASLEDQLPLNPEMDHWLKEIDLHGRGIHFDYFHRLFEFRIRNDRANIFFYDTDLDQIFKELLNVIREFELKSAQYMSPSEGRNNYFEIPRHTDRRAYDPNLDARENQRGIELNDLATRTYNLFERLYGDGRRKLVR